MKNKFLGILILLSVVCVYATQAQDFHFSQFYNFPAAINPAQAGRMREDVRAGLIYRSQWRQVNSPYATFGVAADMNILKVPKFLDKVGVGLLFVNDELPDHIFRNQQMSLSLAFHKSLDAYKRHKVSIGFQPGFSKKSFSQNGLFTRPDIQNYQAPAGGTTSDAGLAATGATYSAFNLNAGVYYDFTVNEKLILTTGGSLFNITAPKESVLKNAANYDPNRLGRRFLITVGGAYKLSNKMTLLPAIMYMGQKGATDFNLGSGIGYHLNEKKDITLLLGAWYRTSDAGIAMAGMQYKNIKAVFTYDATMSSLNDIKKAPNVKSVPIGAYEFTITYVGFLSRALPNDVTIPCRFF